MRRSNLPPVFIGMFGLLIVTAVSVGLLLWNGLTGDNGQDGSPIQELATGKMTEPVFLQSHVSGPSEAVQLELAHVDPSVDGWDTEAFSERASKQLKQLASAIRGWQHSNDAPSFQKLLHEDFSCGALKPASLKNVFKDPQLTISRWEPGGSSQQNGGIHRQYEGFQLAMKSLLAPWRKATGSIRSSFKILSVEVRDDEFRTTLQTQLAGPTADGFAQQDAIWICSWHHPSPNAPPLIRTIAVEQFEEVLRTGESRPLLQDCTAAVLGNSSTFREQFEHGIDYWRDRLDWRLGLDVLGPHGLAIGDVNGDGLDDLFVCEPGGLPNRLFVQNADGTATDVSGTAGIDWLEPAASSLFVDMDNDGDQDLLFTSGRFFISCENKGDATFQLQTVQTMPGIARSMAAADFNLDGKLDVYVCCYFYRQNAIDGVGMAVPMPYHDANNAPPNVLFENLGDWQFKNVTSDVGLDNNNRRFSFAASWEDYDNDGDLDLYVANDFGRNNLFRNDGGRFVDVAALMGVEDVASGMSVSWGDYNRDGHMDLYVGNMFSSAGNRVMHQHQFRPNTDQVDKHVYRRFARGNTLFENNGDGTFRDVSLETGVNMGRWAWGSLFADLNNDGWEDILVGNGMVTSKEDSGDL